MLVKDLKVADTVRITSLIAGDKTYRQRLIAMGLIPGTEFTVSRVAPFGDPIEILVRGFALSLRKAEASILQIEQVQQLTQQPIQKPMQQSLQQSTQKPVQQPIQQYIQQQPEEM
jgi:ferrous iron transport protein A